MFNELLHVIWSVKLFLLFRNITDLNDDGLYLDKIQNIFLNIIVGRILVINYLVPTIMMLNFNKRLLIRVGRKTEKSP